MKTCDICQKIDKVHFRIKSTKHPTWIFSCRKCWEIISKEKNYRYGGTRK